MVLAHAAPAARAQTIGNADFASGTSCWDGCPVEVGLAVLYGGPVLGGNVAEVDGNGTAGIGDDRLLCQTVPGFTIGADYLLEFDATRRPSLFTPSTVSVTVTIEGTSLNTVVTRTGGYNMQREHLLFKATQATLSLTVSPNFTSAFGMVLDNFALVRQVTLPVELLAFDVRAEGDAVQMDWSTASEVDNVYFAVQRSTDLQQWDVVAVVPGAGNSQQVLHYSAMDQAPLPGLAYYRLRQVDTDGREWFSDARAVLRDGQRLPLWPDPAVDEVFVSRSDGDGTALDVFDALGRPVHPAQQQLGHITRLEVSALPSGRYHVLEDGGRTRLGTFVKF